MNICLERFVRRLPRMDFHRREGGTVLHVGHERPPVQKAVARTTFEQHGQMIWLLQPRDVQVPDVDGKDGSTNDHVQNPGAGEHLQIVRCMQGNEYSGGQRTDDGAAAMRMGSIGGPHGRRDERRRAAHFDPQSPTFEEGERGAGTESRGEPQAIVRAVHAVASGQCDPRKPTADLHGAPAGGHQREKQSRKRKFHAVSIISALLAATSCATSFHSPSSDSELATLAQPGPYRVAEYDMQWFDARRNRAVPVHIYAPIGAATSAVIVFSHGLGNSRMGYRYLGEHWASHGYLSVHPEHLGANAEVTRHGLWRLYRAGFDRRNWQTVPEDIRFVIDQLQNDATLPSELRGHVDRSRIGVSGHSLGAYGALAVGGLRVLFPDGSVLNFRDRRVRAAIPMSMSENFRPSSYRDIAIPMLHLTGTHDSSIFYGTLPRKRRMPFNSTSGSDQYLIVIRGANHSTYSDDERPGNRAAHDVIRASTLLFWKAYLEDDQAALRQLREGGLERYLDGSARFSEK